MYTSFKERSGNINSVNSSLKLSSNVKYVMEKVRGGGRGNLRHMHTAGAVIVSIYMHT